MYTASDIRNVEFTKNMGGYKVNEVEVFVDNCADTVEALTAERDELNKKLSILADKLVEYRRDEDSIRTALLSAQRMGDSVIRDANEQATQILAKAQKEADAIVATAQNSISHYEGEIVRLKQEVSDFKASILSLYKDHLALLKTVPDVQAEEPALVAQPAPTPVVETVVEPVSEVEDMVEIAQPVEDGEESVKVVEDISEVKSKFANLKFGDDYDLKQDEE